MYDIIIVGGGPAGLTAALYALRAGKSVFIIEKSGFGGQINSSPRIENMPGTPQISGSEFADRLLDQVMSHGAKVELENVISVSREGAHLSVLTEESRGSKYLAKAVILATGVRHRMLGLPSERELVGRGISFCAVCDGAFFSGRRVAVIGGGNSALQEALLLSEICSEVVVVQDLAQFTAEKMLVEALASKPNVRVLHSTVVTGFESEKGELTAVLLRNEQSGERSRLELEGVFVAIGLIPENSAFKSVAAVDDAGYFASGEDCRTHTDGVFVAGDCRVKSVRQLTTATADGTVAALTACNFIDNIGLVYR